MYLNRSALLAKCTHDTDIFLLKKSDFSDKFNFCSFKSCFNVVFANTPQLDL